MKYSSSILLLLPTLPTTAFYHGANSSAATNRYFSSMRRKTSETAVEAGANGSPEVSLVIAAVYNNKELAPHCCYV